MTQENKDTKIEAQKNVEDVAVSILEAYGDRIFDLQEMADENGWEA